MPAPHEISISGSCFQTTTKLKSNAKGRANANKMTRKQDQKPNRKTSVPRNDVNHPRVLQSQHTCIQIIVTEVPHKLHTLCTRLLTQNHNVGTCRAARVARRRATRRSKKPPQPNHAAPHPRLVLQDPRAPPRGRKNHLQHAEIKRPASRVLLRGLREKMPPPPSCYLECGRAIPLPSGLSVHNAVRNSKELQGAEMPYRSFGRAIGVPSHMDARGGAYYASTRTYCNAGPVRPQILRGLETASTLHINEPLRIENDASASPNTSATNCKHHKGQKTQATKTENTETCTLHEDITWLIQEHRECDWLHNALLANLLGHNAYIPPIPGGPIDTTSTQACKQYHQCIVCS